MQDDLGGVHVVLRGGGAVATIDVPGASVRARRSVCPAPRGLAWNPSVRALHVACAGGEFVTLPATGEALPATVIGPDLRDVVVHDGAVYVSEFRRATLRRVDVSGGTARATVVEATGDPATETTAWRLASVAGSLVTLSQSVRSFSLGGTSSTAGYYGNISTATIPMTPHVRVAIPGGEQQFDALVADGGLTVDVAAVTDGGRWRVAVASPGWAFAQGFAQVREWTLSPTTGQRVLRGAADARALRMPGQAVAVAYTASRELIVQTRAPGRIVTPTRTITLYDDEVAEVGHDVFHAGGGEAHGRTAQLTEPQLGDLVAYLESL